MKKAIIILLALQVLQSCKTACTGYFRFTNKSSKTVEFIVNSFGSYEKSFTVKTGKSIDFDGWNDETRFSKIPPTITSILIKTENGKKIQETCLGNDFYEQEKKCDLGERSFFKGESYSRFNGRCKQCDGYEYIFTDEDALRAK